MTRMPARPALPLPVKLAYGVGQLAEGIKNGAFNIFLFFYFNQVLGLSGSLAGLALMIAMASDAICDPVVGSVSDSFRHRWGRRHPFLYASALPLAVSFAFLFRPPAGGGQMWLFAWLTAFAVLVRASMSLFSVPHFALGAELSSDYRERTTVVAFRTAFGLVGVFVLVGLSWTVFFEATPGFENGQLNGAAYPGFGSFFGVAMLAAIMVSALGTHSRIGALTQAPDDAAPFSMGRVGREVREAVSNPSFRALFVGIVVFFGMRGVQETLGLHMSTYFWRLTPGQIRNVQLAGAAGFLPGIPFWTVMARRIDKKPTFLIGIAWFSAFIVVPPLAKIWGWFPAHDSASYVSTLAALAALGVFGAAAALVTAGSMMADIADEHELQSGRRQEGIFFGALSFAGKSASGIGHGAAGLALDWIGFPSQALPSNVPEETVTWLGIIYGPGIGALAVVAIAFMARYRLGRDRHAEIAAGLNDRRRPASAQQLGDN